MFLYADGEIQWGNRSLAGINAGDGVNSVTIPGSLTPSIINITQTSNVGIPGVWMFQVDGGNIIYNHSTKRVVIKLCLPTYVHMYIHTYVYTMFLKTKIFVVCQIFLNKVIFVVKFLWIGSPLLGLNFIQPLPGLNFEQLI